MGRTKPPWWRIAMRLHSAYLNARNVSTVSLPEYVWEDCRSALSRLETTTTRGWSGAGRQLRSTSQVELNRLQIRLEELSHRLRRPEIGVPAVHFLYAELAALTSEFDDVDYRDGTLRVTTAPVTLEGIELGRFSIRLKIGSVPAESSFTVAALEPNPAASSDSTPHPHVRDGRLCTGEGKAAIGAALREGRLFDFFTIVDRILHTYAAGAAYIELNDWHGVPCHDCNSVIRPDGSFTCQACEETLCNSCLTCCENCNTGYCSGCSERCSSCDYPYCENCLRKCARCRSTVCDCCCEGRICSTCVEELQDAQETENEIEDEATAASAEPALQPDGVGEAPLPS